MLKENANNKDFRLALKAGDKEKLQTLLKGFYQRSNPKKPTVPTEEIATGVGFWVVFDAGQGDFHGRLLAVVPNPDKPVPDLWTKNFSFRDYFSGQGRDLEERSREKHPPIHQVHLSQPFKVQ